MGKKRLQPTDLDRTVSRLLKEHAQGISLRNLEELTGISLNNLGRTFRGERTILLSEFSLLCAALGVNDWQILREAHQKLEQPAESDEVYEYREHDTIPAHLQELINRDGVALAALDLDPRENQE